MAEQLNARMNEIGPDADLRELVKQIGQLLDVADSTKVQLDLWPIQNRLLDASAAITAGQTMTAERRQALEILADRLLIHRSLLNA